MAASRLANGPAPILKEGIALAGGDAQNASTNAATIIVETVKSWLGCEGHGKA